MVRPFSLFRKEALELYSQSPEKSRLLVKWRAGDGNLVLKVTNDVKVIKYKTSSLHDLRKVQRFIQVFGRRVENRQQVAPIEQASSRVETTGESKPATAVPVQTNVAATTSTGGSAGAKKKKKKGKK